MTSSTVCNPTVSVIVPVYNANQHGYLAECTDSLLSQTLKDIEIIFVDDGSTDDSLDYLLGKTKKSNNISILKMLKNSGQGAARNRGICESRGKYIGFVDSDDSVTSGYFDALYNLAISNDLEIAAAPLVRTDSNLKITSKLEYPYPYTYADFNEFKKIETAILNPLYCFTRIYKASILRDQSMLFPEGYTYEDNVASFKWALIFDHIGQLSECDAQYYLYRVNNNSTVHTLFSFDKVLVDRSITSEMIIKEARLCGAYQELSEVIDIYYIRLAVLGTFLRAKEANTIPKHRKQLCLLAKKARKNINYIMYNSYFIKDSLKEKIKVITALYIPWIYLRLLETAR
jgi:glycosyltransferase involved in cell wall biosynthesis